MPSLQDFSLIQTNIQSCMKDFNIKEAPNAFYYFALNLILNLQDDEIRDAITDTHYLQKYGVASGHDRGIDALYIDCDETESKVTIHFFNCKYTEDFKKTSSNYPSNETDKITSFLNDLMSQDESFKTTVNQILYSKV